MTMKYDTRSCTITTNWEWGQNGTTPITTTTTRKEVTTSQRWKYTALYDTWAKDGSLSYTGTNFVETVPPPYPGGSSSDGATIYTSGKGMADVTTTSGGDPIYIWGAVSSSNTASSSISYDDGTYAGTLYLDSVSGSPSQPSYSGSYVGQTAQTSTSGTAYYSGDVPLKDTGGGNSPSTPTNFRVTSQNETSVNLAWDASSGATSYSVEVYNKGTTTNPVSQNYGITSTTKFIMGLTTGQSYDIKLYAVNSYSNSVPTWLTDVKIGSARPSNWSWTTLSPTASTYTFGKLRVNLLTHTEWNSFCARVNEFRTYKGIATITFTSASPSGDFTQAMYDEVYNAINAMTSVSSAVGFYTKLVNLSTALNNIS